MSVSAKLYPGFFCCCRVSRRAAWGFHPSIPTYLHTSHTSHTSHTYIHTYITLHYITLHYITLQYSTLHSITLHYITLHYITLHIYKYAMAHIQPLLPSNSTSLCLAVNLLQHTAFLSTHCLPLLEASCAPLRNWFRALAFFFPFYFPCDRAHPAPCPPAPHPPLYRPLHPCAIAPASAPPAGIPWTILGWVRHE